MDGIWFVEGDGEGIKKFLFVLKLFSLLLLLHFKVKDEKEDILFKHSPSPTP